MLFVNLPTAKLVHDTAYLTIACLKTVHSCLSTSEGSILNVHRSTDSVSWFNEKASSQGYVDPKNAVNEELLILLRRNVNFDTDQSGRFRLFGHLCLSVMDPSFRPMQNNILLRVFRDPISVRQTRFETETVAVLTFFCITFRQICCAWWVIALCTLSTTQLVKLVRVLFILIFKL
jgi:hypothetical protein